MLGGIGAPELLVIFAIVLLLFGGKKLPEVAKSMGSAMRAFRDEANTLKREIDLEAEAESSGSSSSSSTQDKRQSTGGAEASSDESTAASESSEAATETSTAAQDDSDDDKKSQST